MTVRWKPLFILSGLFFVVAVLGVISMAWTLVPKSAQGVLKQARAATAAGRFEDAEIYYKQALQFEARSAAVHEEFANLYRDWGKTAAADRQETLKAERVDHLVKAVKFDKNAKGPKLQLLELAMAQDNAAQSAHWARESLKVDAENNDAHYVLAVLDLDTPSPNVPEIKRHLKSLDDQDAPAIRRVFIRARLAHATGDDRGRDEALHQGRSVSLATGADLIDHIARVRLEALDVQCQVQTKTQSETAGLGDRVKTLLAHVKELTAIPDIDPGQVTRLSQVLEQTQRTLAAHSSKGKKTGDRAIESLADVIETDLEAIFQQALHSSQKVDLPLYLTYADHLRFRQQRDRCLQVIGEALHLPAASKPANQNTVMGLHTVAIEMALSKQDDRGRFEKAAPHVQPLLACSEPRFQGMGHLFQGAIHLEQSGLVRAVSHAGEKNEPVRLAEPKLRASALSHLKQAAEQLPWLAEAQARYGVALVLCQEQSLGRQYLQTALRQGNLDPQYQFWVAWTILQAGYPEEAEPIVEALFRQLELGTLPAELGGTLHEMRGEICQARRAPGDLERAAQEFEKASTSGQIAGAAVALRQAQIDVQLGRYDSALARIDQLRAKGQGGPSAENLAVLTFEEQGKKAEAWKLLREARARYPKSAELAGVEAAIANRDGKPEEADRVLKEYLAGDPDNVTLTMMRAQILADSLKRPKDARAILADLAERSDNSSPLVQLAQLELDADDLESARATIAKVQARWKEAAIGEILAGQLALKRGNMAAALEHFNGALKRDPDNKIVQFWKAQLDSRTGSVPEAAKALEELVRNRPTKEVDTGVSLMSAAQSALANLSLQTGNLDDAIRRFEELKRNNQSGTLSRSDRWQLITAYVAKGQWPVARRELAAILNDTKNPPSDDERVRGANLYRQHKDEATALALLDYVLRKNPKNPGAVVMRSFIFLKDRKYSEAAGLLRKGIELTGQGSQKPPAVFYLMLAVVENEMPPLATANKRAQAVLEQGLAVQPQSIELVQAEYLLLASTGNNQGAVAFMEAKAKADPKGPFRRTLIDVLREQKEYEKAERELVELVREAPDDMNLAAALVQIISLEAAQAAAHGRADKQRALDEKAVTMIRDYRKRSPTNLTFLQAECDLVARGGDLTRAIGITEEIDRISKSSTMGPMLRARIYARQEKTREVAKAYGESLARNPQQPDVRVLLAQELIKLGEFDAALEQTKLVLDTDKDRPDAILLEARALAESGASDSEKEASRQSAVARLESAIAAAPAFLDAYHELAEIELKRGRKPAAIQALERALKVNPQDNTAIAKLVGLLAGRGPDGQSPSPQDLEQAKRVAAEVAGRDSKGSLILATAVGFHKAGQFDLALPLSEKAAVMLDSVVAHLNLGDLLLSLAESRPDRTQARPLFVRAVDEYDKVLKLQPGQIEAVNNKAWVLHMYLERSQQALEVMKEVLKHADPAVLPGEFFDTLGNIQETVGRAEEAEQSYLKGLKKTPEHPVLNYHFGKLIATDRSRGARAKFHLAKALAGRGQLSPDMARDAEILIRKLGQPMKAN